MAGGQRAEAGQAREAAALGGTGATPAIEESGAIGPEETPKRAVIEKAKRVSATKRTAAVGRAKKAGPVGAERGARTASGEQRLRAAKPARAGRHARVVLMGRNGPQLCAEGGQKRWTAEKRGRFLEHLAASGNVMASSEAAGMSSMAAYRERKRNDAFRAAWFAAIESGYAVLEAALLARLIEGVEKPVIRGGGEITLTREYRDDVALRLLAAHRETAMRERERQAEAAGAEERRRKRVGFEIKFATLRAQLLTDEAGE